MGLDNQYQTWQNYHNRYWPAHYLIDQNGIIQEIHFGEGEYLATEDEIRKLLQLARVSQEEPIKAVTSAQRTPETYLGFARAQQYAPGRASK